MASAITTRHNRAGSFLSLEEWVNYVIDAEQKPLAAWIEATRFDFESFVCKDAGGPKPRA